MFKKKAPDDQGIINTGIRVFVNGYNRLFFLYHPNLWFVNIQGKKDSETPSINVRIDCYDKSNFQGHIESITQPCYH